MTPVTGHDQTNTLWHGRFAAGPSEALLAFTESLSFDVRLAPYDIEGSRAHVKGLLRANILNDDQCSRVLEALNQVDEEISSGSFAFAPSDEDIHTAVERRVTELAGDAGARLHTGRSRNDQVATDFRLFLKHNLVEVMELVTGLQDELLARATEYPDVYLPGYTHLQRAQPVMLGHHFAAHAWALGRDFVRLLNAYKAADVSPLGAGALAGSSLALDPEFTATELGFSQVFENSLDAVSNRDFVADALYALAMVSVHLSRIGEEFVLWSSEEFGFVKLDDAYSTGSSMLPQKKNADIAELARGKSGRTIGHLTGFLATLKGLPLAYNRDLQEDKEGLFDALDQTKRALVGARGMIATATYQSDNMKRAADVPTSAAIDLAEHLVAGGMPFRAAHEVVAGLVRESLESGRSLQDLVRADARLGQEAAELLNPGVAVTRRTTRGGAGPQRVGEQLERLGSALEQQRATLGSLAGSA